MAKRPQQEKVLENLKMIQTLSGLGLPLHGIAASIGVHKSTLERAAKKNAAVQEAISKGRAAAHADVLKTAYQMAVSGKCPAMTIFYLKTQLRWTETQKIEHAGEVKGQGGAPTLVIDLSGKHVGQAG